MWIIVGDTFINMDNIVGFSFDVEMQEINMYSVDANNEADFIIPIDEFANAKVVSTAEMLIIATEIARRHE